jgi:ubiquinone/menaquinone biosynthesis C-methylase UbiE
LAFDSLAPTYDRDFGTAPAGRLFRFRLAERVAEGAPPRSKVLDVGCGTGEDGIWLSGQGFTVLGIDGSPAMVAEAAAKAARAHSGAVFECRSLEEMASAGQRFDTIVSNFGALNCVPLKVWTEIVPRLLTPSGRAFAVLMAPRPLPEQLRGAGGSASRVHGVLVPVGGAPVQVHYEPVSAVVEALSRHAVVERVEALGCLVPGPGFNGFARRHPIVMALLAMGESVFRTRLFFRGRGDHTLFEFRTP